MKLVVTLDRDEDGMIVVECPAILGCVSQRKRKRDAGEYQGRNKAMPRG